ncbi:MAG: FkbM family methyltransferase [Kiloniellales bacterium]
MTGHELTPAPADGPGGARLVGGVWLPATERHLVEIMQPGAKRHAVRGGKWTYQLHKLEAAVGLVPGDRRRVAVDVGAHVGLWSMWLVKMFEHVHAFEPVPLHARLFERNVTDHNHTLYRIALGDREGRVSLSVPPDQTGHAHVADGARPHDQRGGMLGPETWERIAEVPMKTLDGLGLEQVDFIKVDVEGYELKVIEGARETLLRCRPVLVVEQKGNDRAVYGGGQDEALGWLNSIGARRLCVISGDYIIGW